MRAEFHRLRLLLAEAKSKYNNTSCGCVCPNCGEKNDACYQVLYTGEISGIERAIHALQDVARERRLRAKGAKRAEPRKPKKLGHLDRATE
jgi:hypothetical protein